MDDETPSTSYQSDEYSKLRKRRRNMVQDDIMKLILLPISDESDDEYELDDNDYENIFPMGRIDQNSQPEAAEPFIQNLVNSSQLLIEKISDDDDDDDDDNIPLATLILRDKSQSLRAKPQWRKNSFQRPNDISWKDALYLPDSWNDFTPLQFFFLIFDEKLLEHIVEQTNIYALQSKGTELKVNLIELKTYIGILMKFGLVGTQCYCDFWKNSSRYSTIADAMNQNRFKEIKSFLHFNDNSQLMPRGHPEHDKLHKIRPAIEAIRNNCLKIPQEEHQAIDEQIIPTKCHSALKQYNPKKPHKCGYKVISRAGESGFVYDFLIYTGKSSTEDPEKVGVASSYVLKLSQDVPRNKNYKLFFDNWFSSLPLIEVLNDQGILFLSTVRSNRLKGINLREEKYMKKEGRGSFDFRVDEDSNTIAIKWYDNKIVHLLSNYAGIEPTDLCKEWDRRVTHTVEVARPFAVNEYNKFIGGVDLADMLIELYHIDLKSRKWYTRIFFYLLDMSIVNAWLLYRRVQSVKNVKSISLFDFKEDVSYSLMTSTQAKRGRPTDSKECVKKKRNISCHPADSVRLDEKAHWPEWVDQPQRCKKCMKAQSNVICSKCGVALCFTKNRNCYLIYHKK